MPGRDATGVSRRLAPGQDAQYVTGKASPDYFFFSPRQSGR